MFTTDSVLNSWWLLPVLWIGLSLLASAALSTARRAPAPAPEESVDEPVEAPPFLFDHPDAIAEPIGRYMGAPIHRRARFGGIEYEFDRICPPHSLQRGIGERVIAPGIVYKRLAPRAR